MQPAAVSEILPPPALQPPSPLAAGHAAELPAVLATAASALKDVLNLSAAAPDVLLAPRPGVQTDGHPLPPHYPSRATVHQAAELAHVSLARAADDAAAILGLCLAVVDEAAVLTLANHEGSVAHPAPRPGEPRREAPDAPAPSAACGNAAIIHVPVPMKADPPPSRHPRFSAPPDGKTVCNGAEVREIPGQGKGLVATSHIPKGSLVIMEQPFLSYDLSYERDELANKVYRFIGQHKGNEKPGALPYAFQWTLWLCRFFELPPEDQAKVRAEVYSPVPGDGVEGVAQSATFAEAETFAAFILDTMTSSFTAMAEMPVGQFARLIPRPRQELAALGEGEMEAADVARLLLLYTCNFHQFEGRGALFRLASKLNHVCGTSNTVYTTHEVEGWACHVATRDIAEGEQISTDYLHGIPHLSTFERRKKLLETKLFLCGCQTCLTPDRLRVFPCVRGPGGAEGEAGGCGGTCYGGPGGTWQCEGCGASFTEGQLFGALYRALPAAARGAGRGKRGEGKGSVAGSGALGGGGSTVREADSDLFRAVEAHYLDLSYCKLVWSMADLDSRIAEAEGALGARHPAVLRMGATKQKLQGPEQFAKVGGGSATLTQTSSTNPEAQINR